jgi:hypothetical protein
MPFIYNDQISFKNPIAGNPILLPINTTGDPFINNVVLFMNGALTDSSPVAKTLINSGAVLSNAQVKYNTNSILVSGSQFLTAPINTDFNLGTGDFTIEFWLRLNATPLTSIGNTFIDSRIEITNINGNYACSISQDLRLAIGVIGGTQLFANNPISLNTWTHIAFSRVSGVAKIFSNGVLDLSASFADNMIQSGDLKIMANAFRQSFPNLSPNCYFDSFRITKGVGRYTANFNAETDTYLQNI